MVSSSESTVLRQARTMVQTLELMLFGSMLMEARFAGLAWTVLTRRHFRNDPTARPAYCGSDENE